MLLCPNTSSNSEDTSSRECPLKDTTSYFTPLSRDLERSSMRLLHKNKDSSGERFSPSGLEHALRKSNLHCYLSCISGRMMRIPKKPSDATTTPWALDGLRQDIQDNNDIIQCTCVPRKRSGSGRESDSSRSPDKNTPLSRKKSPNARQWCTTKVEPPRHTRKW